eukprot:c28181_g1_i2 orf=112-291(-)
MADTDSESSGTPSPASVLRRVMQGRADETPTQSSTPHYDQSHWIERVPWCVDCRGLTRR